MAERPPELRRYKASPAARGLAALAGVLVGVGILAAVGFAVVSATRDDPTPAEPPAAGATTTAQPVLKIVFPEGFTRKEMAQRITAVNEIAVEERGIEPALSARSYARAANAKRLPRGFPGQRRVPNLEGYLFPATYEFTAETTSRELVEKQLEAFRRAWEQVDMKYAESKGLTPYEVVIIASMVEKEVQVPRERPLVAGVIYNRLREGMTLGIDATIRYGFDIPPTEPIRESQLESDNPYNTREIPGLPPTPIANPGLAALQAAAHPAEVDFLFFIRKPDCKSHFFTASEEEFENYSREGLNC